MFLPLLLIFTITAEAAPVRHDIRARLDPERCSIEAEDRITLPDGVTSVPFLLRKGLTPSSPDGAVGLKEAPPPEASPGPAAGGTWYYATPARGRKSLVIAYSGTIHGGDGEKEPDCSSAEGPLTADGCLLTPDDLWYPGTDAGPSFFRLTADLPAGYVAVSAGEGKRGPEKDGRTVSSWTSVDPAGGLSLVCGKYKEYSSERQGVKIQVLLTRPDEALSRRYLEAAGRYLDMYSGLLGRYPYGKFALAEGITESEFAQPSLAVLGPTAFRSPSAARSALPGLMVRSWFGGGVLPAEQGGVWSDGLAEYLSGHLFAEAGGRGAEYRKDLLRACTVSAAAGKGRPLRGPADGGQDGARDSACMKAAMFFHMLRTSQGDEAFREGLRAFYRSGRSKPSSFEDIRSAFEKRAGAGKLAAFFDQWLDRPDAPELRLDGARAPGAAGGGYDLEFTVSQEQDALPYRLEAPVAIHLEGVTQPKMRYVTISRKRETFRFSSPVRPVRVELDPEYDVFRKLSPLEIQPTFSAISSGGRPLLVVPSSAEEAPAWAAFAAGLDGGAEIRKDSDLSALPGDRPVWVLGRDNAFYTLLAESLRKLGAGLTPGRVILDGEGFQLGSGVFAFAAHNPSSPERAAGLVIAGRTGRLAALPARLADRGKYGYLALGPDMNELKAGVWDLNASPLSAVLRPSAVRPSYPVRSALAEPAPRFSEKDLRAHILALAPGYEGRGPGEPGLENAARRIEGVFRRLGLKPFFDGAYLQEWREGGRVFRNLAGMVEGSSRGNEYVVIGAHYDHLPADDTGVYPGADDNASGVAMLLELAGYYSGSRPERTLVFAAFDGEEQERSGSRYFVRGLGPAVGRNVNAVLNLDTVGRLNDGKMLFLNSDSSAAWPDIIRAAAMSAGAVYASPRAAPDRSDQISFIEAGIPGLQLFSGEKPEYHRVSDTEGGIDYAGMIKEAGVAAEIIDLLSSGEPLPRPAARREGKE